MKKIISLFLTLCMFFTFMPAVFANNESDNVIISGDFAYSWGDSLLTDWIYDVLYAYTGNDETVIVPEKIPDIEGYNNLSYVTSIGKSAFAGNTTVKNVLLPELSVINIRAFSGCSNLENVIINSVHAEEPECKLFICEYAFENCVGLKKFVLPAHTYRIEDRAFSGCYNLKEVVIPKKTADISDNAFEGCNEDLTIVCDPGTYAESYAQKNGMKFRYATEADFQMPSLDSETDNPDSEQPNPNPPKSNVFDKTDAESISIKGAKNITLTDGKSKKLSAAVSPKGSSDIVWTTSNKKTVSVNKNGKITAKKPGKAVITAKAGGKKAKITVKVIPKAVKKLSVSKKARRITIKINKSDKSYKTYIEYRKKGAKKYKKLALTGKTKYQKKLKKGSYQIRACSYVKSAGGIYKSRFTSPKTISIK